MSVLDTDRVVVVGQAARDLVLRSDSLPPAGGSAPVTERIERLGGKGANIAVGLRQLNPDLEPVLLAVLGTDVAGDLAYREAAEAGLNVTGVARRGRTALMVDLVTRGAERRLLEDVPSESLLSVADIAAAADVILRADVVVLQLQQRPQALLAAARLAVEGGARIVLDGAVEGDGRDELLAAATVIRADGHEAALLTGTKIVTRADARHAAIGLLAGRTTLVALTVPGEGDLVTWRDGEHFYPHGETPIEDPTGAGDAFVAGLVTGLLQGSPPNSIGRLANDAASAVVKRLGGHPELTHLSPSGGDSAEGSAVTAEGGS